LNVEKPNRTQNILTYVKKQKEKKQNKKTSEKPNLGSVGSGSVSLAGGDGAGEGR
jgi:hypothetical protein